MKAVHSLLAVTLSGALSCALLTVAGSDPTAAKPRHHVSGDGSLGPKSSGAGQKSGGAPDSAVTNSPTGNSGGNTNANTSARDKGDHNSSGPTNDGLMKKGDDLPGKAGPQNPDTVGPGTNRIGDRDGGHQDRDVAHPGKNNSADTAKGDNIIADGPGHKVKKPTDTTKKITTIFRPHLAKDHQHPTAPGKIERNAIGVALQNAGTQKSTFDSKVIPSINGAPASPAGPITTKTTTNTVTPTIGRSGNNAAEGPPKNGLGINGTSFSRPPSANLAGIGGPRKNIVGALSGSSFKPRHP
jgi:hypothetical protein